jgi:hypothetical protein
MMCGAVLCRGPGGIAKIDAGELLRRVVTGPSVGAVSRLLRVGAISVRCMYAVTRLLRVIAIRLGIYLQNICFPICLICGLDQIQAEVAVAGLK